MIARRRTVLAIGIVRPLGSDDLDQLATQVGAALGAPLVRQVEHETVLMVTDLLGMRVELVVWPSRPERLAYLHGYKAYDDPTSIVVDVSDAVIDLFAESGLGTWRLATDEDVMSAQSEGT